MEIESVLWSWLLSDRHSTDPRTCEVLSWVLARATTPTSQNGDVDSLEELG